MYVRTGLEVYEKLPLYLAMICSIILQEVENRLPLLLDLIQWQRDAYAASVSTVTSRLAQH